MKFTMASLFAFQLTINICQGPPVQLSSTNLVYTAKESFSSTGDELDYILFLREIIIQPNQFSLARIETVSFFIELIEPRDFKLNCGSSSLSLSTTYEYQKIKSLEVRSYIKIIPVPEAHNKYENIVLQIPITNYEDVDNEVFLLGFEVTDFKEKINLEITKNEVYLSSVKVFLRKPLTLKISSVQLQIILSRKKGTIHSMTYRAENFNLSISAIPCMDNADTFLFQSGLKGFSQPFDPQLVIKTPEFTNSKGKGVFTSSLFSNIHHHHIFQPFRKA